MNGPARRIVFEEAEEIEESPIQVTVTGWELEDKPYHVGITVEVFVLRTSRLLFSTTTTYETWEEALT